MRILLDYRPALRDRTGVGEYTHELAAALARSAIGDDVVLFSSSWKNRLEPGRVPGTTTIDAHVPVTILNTAWHRLGWPAVEYWSGPIDIAHAFHPLMVPSRRAARVVTIHDLDFLDHPERTTAEIRRDYPALAPQHARDADLVVTNSRFTAAQIAQRLGVPADRIVICSPGAPPWMARTPPPANAPILFLGTLEPRKNVGGLIAAYRLLIARRPDAPPLWLAGAATSAAAPWLRAIAAAPLAGRVRHLGYVPSDERYGLYTQASMLVLPSHHEGFGLPVLEAMTAGVPVIASARGALPEVAGDAALFIDPDDPATIADAMERYLTNRLAAEMAVARGLERSRAYSWDAAAGTLRAAYDEALARRTRE